MNYKEFEKCIKALGISEEEIRKTSFENRIKFITQKYRNKAKVVHPDKINSPEGKRMKEVNRCYEELINLGRDLPIDLTRRAAAASAAASTASSSFSRGRSTFGSRARGFRNFQRSKGDGDTPFFPRNTSSRAEEILKKSRPRRTSFSAAAAAARPRSSSSQQSSNDILSSFQRPRQFPSRFMRGSTTTIPNNKRSASHLSPKRSRRPKTQNISPTVARAAAASAKRKGKRGGKKTRRKRKSRLRKRRTKRKRLIKKRTRKRKIATNNIENIWGKNKNLEKFWRKLASGREVILVNKNDEKVNYKLPKTHPALGNKYKELEEDDNIKAIITSGQSSDIYESLYKRVKNKTPKEIIKNYKKYLIKDGKTWYL